MAQIDNEAFYCCSALDSITIPNSVTIVNNHTFDECPNIKSISLGEGLKTIGISAFDCTSVENLVIPNSVTAIESTSFSNIDGIKNLTIGGGISEITQYSNYCFANLNNLETLVLSEGIEKINNNFNNCPNLSTVTVPSTITEIDNSSFSGCDNLKYVFYGDSENRWNTISGNYHLKQSPYIHFNYAEHNIVETVIPPSCNENGYTLHKCNECGESYTDNYTDLLPHSYQITILYPDRNNIGQKTYSCEACGYTCTEDIPKLTADEPLISGKCGENVIYTFDKESSTLTISGTGAMTDYTNLKSPFREDTFIKHIVIENGVTTVGEAAFLRCYKLESITIPDSTISIGKNAFNQSGITFITIPDNVSYIGMSAFSYCSNLQQIDIPISVTTIGSSVFTACYNLKEINVDSENNHYLSDNGVLYNKNQTTLICYPPQKTDLSFVIPNSVNTILGTAFFGNDYLEEITLPSSINKIGYYAFNCSNLKYVFYNDDREMFLSIDNSDSTVNVENDGVFIHYDSTNHTWDNGELITNATCTESGEICYHCLYCNKTHSDVTPAKNHIAVVDQEKAPTCTETGLTEGSHCSACGTILTPQETIPATGHNYSLSVTPPSCNENGYTTYTCSNCGDAYTSDYVEAINHDYAVTTKEATCTEKGQITYTCKVCSYSYSVDTEMVEHSIVIDNAIPATCTESGLTEGCHCSVCNTVISAQETIPATGHTEVVDNGYEATCETEGLSDGCHCSVCNTVIVSQEPIPAAGHHWDNGLITKEATYTETGEILFTCTTCGTSKTETIPCVEKRGKIVVSNEVVKAGDEVNVKIYIEENPGIAGLSIDVIFPEELTLKEVNYTDLFTSKPSNSQGYLNPFTISWLSVQSSDRCETGLFATLTFATDIDAELSDYTIQVTYQENNIVDGTPTAIPFDIINGTVTINKPTSGDVNRDGAINMKDLVLIQQYINHWNVSIVERAADVDNDGGITMKDLVILQQYINGWEVELK